MSVRTFTAPVVTAATAEPCGCLAGSHNHGDPGGFYVTVKDGRRTGWLLGPYATHGEALAHVDDGRRLARAVDDRAAWYAFGTSRICDGHRPPGVLNKMLGAQSTAEPGACPDVRTRSVSGRVRTTGGVR
jgi:hypothetical protein